MSCVAAAPLAGISPKNRSGFQAARAGGKEFTEQEFRNISVGFKCSLQLRMGNYELKLELGGLRAGTGRSGSWRMGRCWSCLAGKGFLPPSVQGFGTGITENLWGALRE